MSSSNSNTRGDDSREDQSSVSANNSQPPQSEGTQRDATNARPTENTGGNGANASKNETAGGSERGSVNPERGSDGSERGSDDARQSARSERDSDRSERDDDSERSERDSGRSGRGDSERDSGRSGRGDSERSERGSEPSERSSDDTRRSERDNRGGGSDRGRGGDRSRGGGRSERGGRSGERSNRGGRGNDRFDRGDSERGGSDRSGSERGGSDRSGSERGGSDRGTDRNAGGRSERGNRPENNGARAGQNDEQGASDSHEDLKSPPREENIPSIPVSELRDQSRQRAKKQPILQKIARVLSGKHNSPYREVIINAEPLETRVAVIEDGVLEKFEVERSGEQRMVGAIFKGKIQNLENGLKAAFVDIGQPKNAFLHYWDIVPGAQEDHSVEIVRDTRSDAQKKKPEKINIKDVPRQFPINTEIVVQITKAQIGTKGPRTTTNLAIPGRFLVLMPYGGQCGISRKIESREERDRLKKILRTLTIPEGMGVIVRTAGEGKKIRYFVRDLHILLKKWEAIDDQIKNAKSPCLLYQEPDIIERTVRDFLTEDIDRVLVDSEDRFQAMLNTVSLISPRSRRKIAHFSEDIPIFERFNIERQIEQTFQRRVPLLSGGEIVIEETEALVAIDVNTGSHRGGDKDGKNYILQANLEAAAEAARQIRLRNIGGLIITDFIDMKSKKDRRLVYERMRKEMSGDKAKNHILPISQLGIMQMTRQRHSESHASGIYTGCPYCGGRGIVKSPRSMSVEIQRKVVSIIRHLRAADKSRTAFNLRVLLHPTNLERLRSEDYQHLLDIEKAYNATLSFRADATYHVESFKVVDAESGKMLR